MTTMLPSREDPFSYESSFWVDVRKNRERRATPARIKAALEGKVGHRKRGRGDERETWYIGQILHYGLGSAKTTKAAARQRLVEAAKAGKLKVPEPILVIEKRLKEDYQERSGKEQRSRVKQKKHARIAIDRTKSMNTGYSDEGIKSQETEGWEGFRTGTMKMDQPHMFTLPRTEGRLAVDDSSWHKEYEAEIQAKVKRRQEKYKAAKLKGPLEPLEGTWKIDTTDILRSGNPQTLIFRHDQTKSWGAFDFDLCEGILLLDPAPSKASNAPLPFVWRGRDTGTGEMRWLESECTGEVVFLGGGKIMGCLNLGCDVDFIGTLVAEMNEQARTVKDMEKEWKGYNERAHAREEVTRWGGRWHRGYEDEEDEDVEGGSDQDGSGDLPYPMPR